MKIKFADLVAEGLLAKWGHPHSYHRGHGPQAGCENTAGVIGNLLIEHIRDLVIDLSGMAKEHVWLNGEGTALDTDAPQGGPVSQRVLCRSDGGIQIDRPSP